MARVDYDRMGPDHLEGRALPAAAGRTGLRLLPDDQFADGLAALERDADAETTPVPVVDRLDLLVLRKPARERA